MSAPTTADRLRALSLIFLCLAPFLLAALTGCTQRPAPGPTGAYLLYASPPGEPDRGDSVLWVEDRSGQGWGCGR